MTVTLDVLQRSGRLRRADAALAAWVARAFPDAAPEVALAAALAARAVGDGHSTLELTRVHEWFAQLEGAGRPPELPEAGAWQAALRAAAGACRTGDSISPAPLTLDTQGRIYLSRYFDAERRVAATLAAHATGDDAENRSPVPGPRSPGSELDPEQHRAIDIALSHHFALITGSPGSGKTFSVAHMLAALVRDGSARGKPPRIALAAPTGKAATRLAESLRAQVTRMNLPDTITTALPRDASTLHRLLGISPWRAQPRHHRGVPLPFDVVVVDEASMIDLPLMARLGDALASDARLILLGDPNQLSAVEAGNVLPALVEAASAPPFDACHVTLARSHRFGADSALGRLAQAIVANDVDTALTALRGGDNDVRWIDDDTQAMRVESACAGYAPVFAAHEPAAALAAARDFRVLTALRHGPHGCLALNRAIEARLKRTRGLHADAEWWPGRLILVTANRDELGLYNGDTGVVWPDADGSLRAWFEGAVGPRAFAPAALPPHEGAFALTVHKAQGSEFGRVALVTGPDSPALTRELLYTGITRARIGITVYADADILRAGIGRRTLRMTGLAERLREAAAGT
ncbi:MAG: exodeoxyribonuclease V subunit alpha [Rhodanobacteraceae bacterium]|nr:MAG: exodeoxyribonuclease V subunit alpha [Rhodanobacteraceae bacterium]